LLVRVVGSTIGCSGWLWPLRGRADELRERTGVDDPGDAECPPEGAPPLRQRETTRIEMKVRTATRSSTGQIGYDAEDRLAGSPHLGLLARRLGTVLDRDDPQQLGGWCTSPATHTGAHRERATYHCGSLPCIAPARLAR